MSPPDRSELFVHFRKPGVSRDQLVFEGWVETPYVRRGIYHWAYGQTSAVVNTITLVPGESVPFEDLITPKIDGDIIAFTGRWSGTEAGIFYCLRGLSAGSGQDW